MTKSQSNVKIFIIILQTERHEFKLSITSANFWNATKKLEQTLAKTKRGVAGYNVVSFKDIASVASLESPDTVKVLWRKTKQTLESA